MADKQSKSDNNSDDKKKNGSVSERTPLLEWIFAAVGLILVASSIGYIAYYSATSKEKPPEIQVEIVSIKNISNGYLVEFKASNKGEKAAASVQIEGKISEGESEIESKNATLDYIASDSEQRGGLYFSKDPNAHNLEVKAIGYENP